MAEEKLEFKELPEELFGKGNKRAIGKIYLRKVENVEYQNESLPKVEIGGMVFGNLTSDDFTEMWECGFNFLPKERYESLPEEEYKKKGYPFNKGRINEILKTGGWADPKEWKGERLPRVNLRGIGKLLVYPQSKTLYSRPVTYRGLERFMIGGQVIGKSFEDVGELELFVGEMRLTPVQIFQDTCFPGVNGGLSINQALSGSHSNPGYPLWFNGEDYETRRFHEPMNNLFIEHFKD